jgi:hypothetical protein
MISWRTWSGLRPVGAAHIVEYGLALLIDKTGEQLLRVPEDQRPGKDLRGRIQCTDPCGTRGGPMHTVSLRVILAVIASAALTATAADRLPLHPDSPRNRAGGDRHCQRRRQRRPASHDLPHVRLLTGLAPRPLTS